jgi:hypothetical protein
MTTVTPAYMEFSFSPSIVLVTLVRRFVMDFYRHTLGRSEDIDRLGLVVHEMLENCMKYSVDGASSLRVEIGPGPLGARASIITRNRADAENLAEVARRFDAMGEASDPFTHYQAVMQRSLLDQNRSGLGLARIWWEAQTTLTRTTEDDGLLQLRAECDLALEPVKP